eukprot:snap_masked-scaffold_19-processed-gene-1.46-mRNA-1 protein AED:1.00 eAED:1.00 QI:0/0/0/0/1/1/2/0/363
MPEDPHKLFHDLFLTPIGDPKKIDSNGRIIDAKTAPKDLCSHLNILGSVVILQGSAADSSNLIKDFLEKDQFAKAKEVLIREVYYPCTAEELVHLNALLNTILYEEVKLTRIFLETEDWIKLIDALFNNSTVIKSLEYSKTNLVENSDVLSYFLERLAEQKNLNIFHFHELIRKKRNFMKYFKSSKTKFQHFETKTHKNYFYISKCFPRFTCFSNLTSLKLTSNGKYFGKDTFILFAVQKSNILNTLNSLDIEGHLHTGANYGPFLFCIYSLVRKCINLNKLGILKYCFYEKQLRSVYFSEFLESSFKYKEMSTLGINVNIGANRKKWNELIKSVKKIEKYADGQLKLKTLSFYPIMFGLDTK